MTITTRPPKFNYLFIAVLLVLICFYLSSCYLLTKSGREQHQQAKIEKQANKDIDYLKLHNKLALPCSINFPFIATDSTIKTSADSSGYLQSIAYYKEYVKGLNTYIDTLVSALKKKSLDNKDTSCTLVIQALADAYNQREAAYWSRQDSIKPVVIYKDRIIKGIDSAAQKVLQNQISVLNDRNSKLSADRDNKANQLIKRTHQRNFLFWIIVIVTLWTFRKPIVNLLTPAGKISWIASLFGKK